MFAANNIGIVFEDFSIKSIISVDRPVVPMIKAFLFNTHS